MTCTDTQFPSEPHFSSVFLPVAWCDESHALHCTLNKRNVTGRSKRVMEKLAGGGRVWERAKLGRSTWLDNPGKQTPALMHLARCPLLLPARNTAGPPSGVRLPAVGLVTGEWVGKW